MNSSIKLNLANLCIWCPKHAFTVSDFSFQQVLVEVGVKEKSKNLEVVVTSQERKPFISLGTCIAESLPYVQSLRHSSMGGTTNWWKWVPAGAQLCSAGVAHFPITHVLHVWPAWYLVTCTMFSLYCGANSDCIDSNRSRDVVNICTHTSHVSCHACVGSTKHSYVFEKKYIESMFDVEMGCYQNSYTALA